MTKTYDLQIVRNFDAPRMRVWRAWTQSDLIARWWGPEGFTTRIEENDFRTGGRTRFVMTGPDGTDYPVEGCFLEIVEGERITTSDEFGADYDGENLPEGVLMVYEFADLPGDKCQVTLTIRHPTQDDLDSHRKMGVFEGWHSSLNCLTQLLGELHGSEDEAAILDLAKTWAQALQAKDVDGLLADYTEDTVLFDMKPPAVARGLEAYRQNWEDCLPYFPDAFRAEHRDLVATASGDVAFAHGFLRIVPDDTSHPAAGSGWMRVTLCYRREEGRWRVAHEHVSVPVNPDTGVMETLENL